MKIIWVVLVPLIVGQIFRRWVREWADRNKKRCPISTSVFKRKDGIAFFFSATQKALATGIPMVHALFEKTPLDLAFILVPLMFYHPLQLLLGSFVVGKFARAERLIYDR